MPVNGYFDGGKLYTDGRKVWCLGPSRVVKVFYTAPNPQSPFFFRCARPVTAQALPGATNASTRRQHPAYNGVFDHAGNPIWLFGYTTYHGSSGNMDLMGNGTYNSAVEIKFTKHMTTLVENGSDPANGVTQIYQYIGGNKYGFVMENNETNGTQGAQNVCTLYFKHQPPTVTEVNG